MAVIYVQGDEARGMEAIGHVRDMREVCIGEPTSEKALRAIIEKYGTVVILMYCPPPDWIVPYVTNLIDLWTVGRCEAVGGTGIDVCAGAQNCIALDNECFSTKCSECREGQWP